MLYLGIMFAVAALGLLRLYLLQRRETRTDWKDIDNLKSSLERLSAQPPPQAVRPQRPAESKRQQAPARRSVPPRNGAPASLDPQRRAAAKQRIEARRRRTARARAS